MRPEIASLHERMKQGGDWRAFRDEIASLHAVATTEGEYVILLEAHHNLVPVGKHAYDEETYAKLLPIAEAEYKMLLNKESIEDDIINPVLLERVTRREAEAGRLDPNDDFRKFAVAGASVLGDSAEINAHRCKHLSPWVCCSDGSSTNVSASGSRARLQRGAHRYRSWSAALRSPTV